MAFIANKLIFNTPTIEFTLARPLVIMVSSVAEHS